MRRRSPIPTSNLHLVFRREGGLFSTIPTLPRVETRDGGPQSPAPVLHPAFRRKGGHPYPPSRRNVRRRTPILTSSPSSHVSMRGGLFLICSTSFASKHEVGVFHPHHQPSLREGVFSIPPFHCCQHQHLPPLSKTSTCARFRGSLSILMYCNIIAYNIIIFSH